MTLVEIIGIIFPIAAAFDLLTRPTAKIRVANYILKYPLTSKPMSFTASDFLDRYFGPSLISQKAIMRSVYLSASSVSLSYFIAFTTSDFDTIYIFDGVDRYTILLFLIFFSAMIIGDCLSFCQTRIFVRAMDSVKSDTVSIGLTIGDGFISIFIFVITFSVARMISYVLVVSMIMPSSGMQGSAVIDLDEFRHFMKDFSAESNWKSPSITWLNQLAKLDKNQAKFVGQHILSEHQQGNAYKTNELFVETKVSCSKSEQSYKNNAQDGYNFIAGELARYAHLTPINVQNLDSYVTYKFKSYDEQKRSCGRLLLSIDQRIKYSFFLRNAGFVNVIWASFERTFFDLYTSISFKFGGYADVDPIKNIGEFVGSLISESSWTLLGINNEVNNIGLFTGNQYPLIPDRSSIRIPFSPMLSSALSTTLLLFFYLTAIYISRIVFRLTGLINTFVNMMSLESAPFSFIGLALVSLWGTLIIVGNLINFCWKYLL
jgi:hypothetical protein